MTPAISGGGSRISPDQLQSQAIGSGPPPLDNEAPVTASSQTLPLEGAGRTLTILTANINSWAAFRARWSSDGDWEELEKASMLLLQEHHVWDPDLRDDAIQWLDARGWLAVFGPAQKLSSGKASEV